MSLKSISIVIPFYNEAGNVLPLVEDTIHAVKDKLVYSLILVDDGSRDSTYAEILSCVQKYPEVTAVRHSRQKGQSAALKTGIELAPFEWILTLDGDGQNNPADLVFLLNALKKADPSQQVVVFGVRVDRKDSLLRYLSSKLANRIRQFLLKDNSPDTGCALKLFPRSGYLSLPQFNHLHRFLPALFQREGYQIINVPVSHRPRMRGKSKYGFWKRLVLGFWDLLGVRWLIHRPIKAEIAFIEGQLKDSISNKKIG